MSSDRRFEQDLPRLLGELYMGPMPPYRDDVVERTAGTRQRPAWSFIGRWLPVVGVVRRPVPWRSIGLLVLVVGLTLALLATLIAGSQRRVPAPFGPARAGLVAYAVDGDIYTVDPATGASTAVVTGAETDLDPRWSRDGTHFAFIRKAQGESGPGLVYMARADGTDLTLVTPAPLAITSHEFSPDGSEILLSVGESGIPLFMVVKTDGSEIRELDVGMLAKHASWRPPDGSEILFMNYVTSSNDSEGLYAVSADGRTVRTILEPSRGRYRDLPAWSPDGSQIAYMEWLDSGGITSRIHIIGADGTGDRLLPMPPGALWEVFRGWSNDGSRLLAIRGYAGGWTGSVTVARPAGETGFGVEFEDQDVRDANCCSVWEWAPDDTSILGTPSSSSGHMLDQVLLDPVTGASTAVPWTTSSHPTWQRLAP